MLFKEITSEEFAEIRAKEAAEIYYNKGRQEGIMTLIAVCRELGLAEDQIQDKLIEKYQLSREAAREYVSE